MIDLSIKLDVTLTTIGNIVDFRKEIKLYNLKNLIIGKDVCNNVAFNIIYFIGK